MSARFGFVEHTRRLERELDYFRAHRERDRGLMLLCRIFQPSVADRFLREVLFPEGWPV
jgi:hypothetical protein